MSKDLIYPKPAAAQLEHAKACILVAGMHRSGTSATARVVNLLGAHITAKLAPAQPGINERGFWESAAIFRIHDELLRGLGSSWDDPFPLADRWLETTIAQETKSRIVAEINDDFADSSLFVVKDPRLTRLLPLWLNLFKDLHIEPIAVIIPFRNPMEVAMSLQKRDGIAVAKSILMWVHSNLEVELASRGLPRMFLHYDELLADWQRFADVLRKTLPHIPRPSAESIFEINRFLSRDLRHNSSTREMLVSAPDMPAVTAEIYDRMLQAAKEGDNKAFQGVFDRLRGTISEATKLYKGLVLAERQENRRLVDNLRRGQDAIVPGQCPVGIIYICHSGHEQDRTYSENLTEYFKGSGTACKIIEMNSSGLRPELQQCLDDHPIAVLGFNSQLDHSWLPTGSFLEAAASRHVPVIQWILDHPSCRWPEFNLSTSNNSRFLLNTRFAQEYFLQYCMSDAVTASVGGVGASHRSRIDTLSQKSFLERPINCLIPISLKRAAGTIAETQSAIEALGPPLATAVREAHALAVFDLMQPIEMHLVTALERGGHTTSNDLFNSCFHLLEESVQTYRRLKIFKVARDYPVVVQSDETAMEYFDGAAAHCVANVGVHATLSHMQLSHAVLSVSPLNDMVHDRTMNGLNAGCVSIVEDNLAHRSVFHHGKNALLFRYDDDSLQECLDIVCNRPEQAFAIAEAGFALRDKIRFENSFFGTILDIARRSSVTRSGSLGSVHK
jgi:hypothetical protein